MKFNDARSFKVAVVADYFVNPRGYDKLPDSSRVFDILRDSGYGIVKMPPIGISAETASAWVTETVDQIQEYTNRGFRVVMIGAEGLAQGGLWLDSIEGELRARGLVRPPTLILKSDEMTQAMSMLEGLLTPRS